MQLPADLESRDLEVRGQVTGVPERVSPKRLRLPFRIDAWRDGDDWQHAVLPVRLAWYRDAEPMQAGERWQLRVRLKRPHGLANPGGFDYQRWLFAHAIRATGYIRTGPGNERLATSDAAPWQSLRARLSAHFQQLDQPAQQRALLRALALGDRAGMSRDQWQVLQRTGTSHLLAISGLHVGLVASLVFGLAGLGWRRLGGARYWPAPRAAALAAMLAALLYALLSGFQVPAQRATLMIWMWMGAILAGAGAQPRQVLGLALLATLLHTPLAALTAGFWLSYGAVTLILYLCLGRHGNTGRLRRTLHVQLGLVAGLTPLLWLWFQQAAPAAPLANLVAIPWVSLLVVPPLLLAVALLPLSPGLADALLSLTGLSLQGLWRFLQWLDFGGAALWPAPPVGVAGLALFSLGLLVLLLPAACGVRVLASLLALPVFMAGAPRPAPGDLRLTLLDVGQGLAAVVETRHHLLVYDTGPAWPGGFDSGSRVLVPFLRQRGYRRLDRLVVSHADTDHSGGAHALYRAMPAASIHAGEPSGIPWATAVDCRQSPGWQWDGVSFTYLAAGRRAAGNNASCVLKVTASDGRSVLLPGDIESGVETALVAEHRDRLAADVLVAPHHGSATSSGRGFIAAVDPSWVLFATGYRNRFGFPRPAVVERYRAAGARLLDTAAAGAIDVRIKAGHRLRVQGWRRRHPRLWHPVDP
jgi:competence protein ComEC